MMISLFRRAGNRLPLTPEERALLKLVFLTIGSAALTGGVAAGQYLINATHSVNWTTVGTVFLSTFGMVLYETGRKWVTAHADGPLSAANQLVSAAIKKAATPAPPPPKDAVKQ